MARWQLSLEIDPASTVPLFVQIATAITADVRSGRLRPGAPLPGARSLARRLEVNRNTVAAAYAELAAEGWVTTSRGRGTFVSTSLPDLPPRRPGPRRGPGARPGFDLPPPGRPGLDDDPVDPGARKWDYGIPDVRLAPVKELARAYRRALRDHGRDLLQYDRYSCRPHSRLQVALAAMLQATRGLHAAPENLVVTRGSQMALYLVAQAIIRPGDTVAVEHPGYPVAWEVFRRAGAQLCPIEVDAEGIRIEPLERLAHERSLRAVFVTPHHQFPTTVTLGAGRRLALLRLARQARFAVIEDDYDHEFHFRGRPVQPLMSGDSDGVVLYMGSLSKIFAPGVRVGYLVAPTMLARRVRALRALIDIQDDSVLDWALGELFEDGEMQRHFNRARRFYLARRDALVQALRDRLGGVVAFTPPSGGMALWARIDPAVDVERWAARARARGLMFRTGRLFFLDGRPRPYVRLGFARWDERELAAAVEDLAAALPARGRG
jgi:GntR family transcriptional regulator/MocR family aminotransferase